MTSHILKLPRFRLFNLLKGFALAVHVRILERRRNRIKLLPPAPDPPDCQAPVSPKLTPTEIEMIQVAEVSVPPILAALIRQPIVLETLQPEVTTLPEAASIPEVIRQPELVLQDKPDTEQQDTLTEVDRATLVLQLLDEAHGRGCKTYAQLIGYVKEQTGTGCSKRTVANWKKQRGLAA